MNAHRSLPARSMSVVFVAASLSFAAPSSSATRLVPRMATAKASDKVLLPGAPGRRREPLPDDAKPLGVDFAGDCGGGSFGTAATQVTPSQPFSITQGDFNRDGDIDIAVPSYGGGVVTPYFGNGAGGLAPQPSVGVGGALSADVMSGDLDSDGDVDLVAVVQTSNAVRVLLNNGAGAFVLSPTLFSVGADPIGGALGDVNGDGNLDAITANSTGGTLSVLPGDGAGGFGPSTAFAAAANPYDPILGDFDRDGDLDALVGTDAGSNVRLLLNNGAGAFAAPLSFATGNSPFRVVAADFNEDGLLDVATANVSGSVSVLIANGPASFMAANTFAVPNAPISVDVADVNGDGALDLAVATILDTQIRLFPGDGAGSFAVGPVITTGGLVGDVKLTDVDTDGRPDMITANYPVDSVSIQLNTCAACPTFFAPRTSLTTDFGPLDAVVRDFDGDGDLDFVVTTLNSGSLLMFFGDGTGGFGAAVPIALMGGRPIPVESADFDSDGDFDLAVGYENPSTVVSILLNNGSGGFGAPANFAVQATSASLVPADLDGDGDVDLGVANINSNSVSVLSGNGDGTFGAATNFGVGTEPLGIVAADVDRDGDLDLATANRTSGDISVLSNNGLGTFSGPVNFPAIGDAEGLVAEDFDHDGDLDLVTGSLVSANLAYLAGDGAGSFAAPVLFAFDRTFFIEAADLNADGELDILGGSISGPRVVIVYGMGTGSFGAPVFPVTDAYTLAATAADLDTNGLLDVVAPNYDGSIGSTVSVILNRNGCFEPCLLTCPTDIVQGNDPGVCGAVVTYPPPTTTGNCGPVTCVPASGTSFPVGTTTVTCTAGINNLGQQGPPSCSFTVTVNDTQAPSITCPAPIVTPGTNIDGCAFTAVVTYPAPAATDNCPGVTASCVPATGTIFPEGTTTVTCTATDTAGNSSQCSFAVTVNGLGVFGACAIDDASGDTWSIVTDPSSPNVRFWRYRVAATGELLCGTASAMAYTPGRSLTAADNDDARFFMNANLSYGTRTSTVTVTDRLLNRRFILRDRNLLNNPPCQ